MSLLRRRRNKILLNGFTIKRKSDSLLMVIIGPVSKIFSPYFMLNYSTIIGNRIYLADSIALWEKSKIERIVSHERIHANDAKQLTWPVFGFLYLFPQSLAFGVVTLPWIGWKALLFLLFLLPIPAPFRFFFEVRAYAHDAVLSKNPDLIIDQFQRECKSWSYYLMWPFGRSSVRFLKSYIQKLKSKAMV